jgi:hypothetical protein
MISELAEWIDYVRATFERARAGFDFVRDRVVRPGDGAVVALELIEDALRLGIEMADEEEFEAAEEAGWEEVSEEELDELIAAGAVEVPFLRTDARAATERVWQKGPRGGVYYLAPSGRKVYARRSPAATPASKKPAEESKTAKETKPAASRKPRTRAKPAERKEPPAPSLRPNLNDLVRNPNINGELKESVSDAMASGLAIGGFSKFYATRDMPTVDITSVQGPGFRRNELHGSALGFYNPKLNQLRLSSREDSLAKSAGKAKALPTGRQQDIRIFSDIATTPEKVAEITATHEFGHAVHMHGVFAYREERTIKYRYADDEARRVDEYVQQRHRDRGTTRAVSRYGADDPKEWFAEAYAAYHHAPDWLKKRSPWLYETVGEVKRMRGL